MYEYMVMWHTCSTYRNNTYVLLCDSVIINSKFKLQYQISHSPSTKVKQTYTYTYIYIAYLETYQQINMDSGRRQENINNSHIQALNKSQLQFIKMGKQNVQPNYQSMLEESQYLKPKINTHTQNKSLINVHTHNKSMTHTNSSRQHNHTVKNKSKKCKSTKRNALSCQHILELARKRETHTPQYIYSSRVAAVYGHHASHGNTLSRKNNKRKKYNHHDSQYKTYRQEWHRHNESHGNLGTTVPNSTQYHPESKTTKVISSRYQSGHHESGQNYDGNMLSNKSSFLEHSLANYPLSRTNSLIVFSDNATTLTNTGKLNSLSLGGLMPMICMSKNKGDAYRRNHSAVVIQKHWRGYMTRKLLQHYIVSEQQKLQAIKQSHHIYNTNIHNMDVDVDMDMGSMDLSIGSSEFPHAYSSQMHNNSEVQKFQQFIDNNNGIDSYQNSNMNNQSSTSNMHTLSSHQQTQQLQQEQQYICRRGGVIGNRLEHLNLMSDLMAINIPSHSADSQSTINTNNHTQNNNTNPINHTNTNHNHNNSKNDNDDDNHMHTQNDTNNVDNTPNNIKIQLANMHTQYKQQLLCLYNQQVQLIKSQLSHRMRTNGLQFGYLLQLRNSLSSIHTHFINTLDTCTNHIEHEFQQLANIGQQPSTASHTSHHITSILNNQNNQSIQHQGPIPITNIQNTSAIQHQQCQPEEEQTLGCSHSPVSQYYTLELPTEELSPYKASSCVMHSPGLQNLKLYLQNIHTQFTHEQHQQSQISFLCRILKRHSEIGAENMMQRCFIQLLVDIVTGQHSLEDVLLAIDNYQHLNKFNSSLQLIAKAQEDQGSSQQEITLIRLVDKWVKQLDKWELGPIEEVSRNMEQSCNISQCSKNTGRGSSGANSIML